MNAAPTPTKKVVAAVMKDQSISARTAKPLRPLGSANFDLFEIVEPKQKADMNVGTEDLIEVMNL